MMVIPFRQTYTKLYILFRTEKSKTIPLTGGTSLYRPYKGVPMRIYLTLPIITFVSFCGYHTLKQH